MDILKFIIVAVVAVVIGIFVVWFALRTPRNLRGYYVIPVVFVLLFVLIAVAASAFIDVNLFGPHREVVEVAMAVAGQICNSYPTVLF